LFQDLQSKVDETLIEISEKLDNKSLAQKSKQNSETKDKISVLHADFMARKKEVNKHKFEFKYSKQLIFLLSTLRQFEGIWTKYNQHIGYFVYMFLRKGAKIVLARDPSP